MKPAAEINVARYRQILIWPLLLKEKPLKQEESEVADPVRSVHRVLEELEKTKGWGAPRRLRFGDNFPVRGAGGSTPAGVDDAPDYAEVIYFHPFVRDFLFGDGKDDKEERAIFRFRRDDVGWARITLADWKGEAAETYSFEVARVELYVCKPLVALLAVEIVREPGKSDPGGNPLNLETALVIQSQFRQVYPPYFDDRFTPPAAGNCPFEVSWLDRSGRSELSTFRFGGLDAECLGFTSKGAEPPVAGHWAWLMQPLLPYRTADEEGKEPGGADSIFCYQQIVDDRIPGMTYLAVDDPRAISEGDFDRLTFCDTGGPAPFPYSEGFLAARREAHVYDRYWRATGDHDLGGEMTTRYLCSGYQFVVVGREGNGFYTDLIPLHFRRHYFRMGLILHYQRAALLKLQDEMADAIKLLSGQHPEQEMANPDFRKQVTILQMTFLKFRSRAWFTEVSNQLQAREMFSWWSGLLGNEALFRQVDESSARLYAALAEYQTRQLTSYATIGGIVAVLLALLSLAASFAGTAISFAAMKDSSATLKDSGWWPVGGVVIAIATGFLGFYTWKLLKGLNLVNSSTGKSIHEFFTQPERKSRRGR